MVSGRLGEPLIDVRMILMIAFPVTLNSSRACMPNLVPSLLRRSGHQI